MSQAPAPTLSSTLISEPQQDPPVKRTKISSDQVGAFTSAAGHGRNAAPAQPQVAQLQIQQQNGLVGVFQQHHQQPLSQPSNIQVLQSGIVPLVASSQVAQSSSTKPATAPVAPSSGVAFTSSQVVMSASKPKAGPKPQEDHTLINCFTIEQIETHIESLCRGLQLSPQKLKAKCLEILRILQQHQHGWVFNSPVDPVELGLPDYFQVIKRPMDLGTIKKRLENGCYRSLEEFETDVILTFDNAMLYNPDGSVVSNMADEMKSKFVMDYKQLMRELNAEEEEKRKNGDACALCGSEKLLFEPPVFYCNGPCCPSTRIRRNSYYFVGGNNQYHWCHQCFGELPDSIMMPDATLKKQELTKKKNDEIHEESWVQCDKCERWIHQVCGLFNTRQNKDQR